MHPIYSAAVMVFGAIIIGVAYYVSSRETPRPHSYSNDRPRVNNRRSPDRNWNRRDNNNSEGGFKCGICLDTCEGPIKALHCCHEFHLSCISRWFQTNNCRTCPVCRLR